MARGVGLGLFAGLLPAVGTQIILALFLAGLLNGNRIAAALATLVSNPFTAVPLGALSIWFGDLVLPGASLSGISLSNLQWSTVMESSGRLGLAYLVGCLALATLSSAMAYASMRVYYAQASRRAGRGLPKQ